MTSNGFRGIPFENPKGSNLCYSNASTNALLSSEHITSKIRQQHCLCCDFLHGMKRLGPHPPMQSSFPLKQFASEFRTEFRSSKQQDVAEYIQTILTNCNVLDSLSQIIVRMNITCQICKETSSTDDKRNILYETLSENSIAKIIPGIERTFPTFLAKCTKCKTKTNHERYEKLLMLPDVLVVNLQRFQKNRYNRFISKNCQDLDPSIILTLDESLYSLNTVITHYGKVNKGHYISTLYRDGQWIECDDSSVETKNTVPMQGYLFFYDRVETQLVQRGISIDDVEEQTSLLVSEYLSQEKCDLEYQKEKEYLNDGKNASLKEKSTHKRIEIEDSDMSIEENMTKVLKKNEDHVSVHKSESKNLAGNSQSTPKKHGNPRHVEISKEKKLFSCKSCKEPVKNLPYHLSKTKDTLGCVSDYSNDEMRALADTSDKRTRARYKDIFGKSEVASMSEMQKAFQEPMLAFL